MKIGLHAFSSRKISHSALSRILQLIHSEGHQIFASASFYKAFEGGTDFFISGIFTNEQEASSLDLLLSIGGDGTLLESLLFTLRNKIPLLGINFGRLGFLPCISDSELENFLQRLRNGIPDIQERAVLELHSKSAEQPFADFPYALNEIAVIKKDSSSMIHIRTEVDGVFLNDYWGDGLIVASPTGSTGYSLSCGGPIIWPDSSVLVITPVSPHNLSMRPLVLNDGMEIHLVPGGRSSKIMLSMDSRSRSFPVNQRIAIRKSTERAIFVKVQEESFPVTLREKLFWGKDFRN